MIRSPLSRSTVLAVALFAGLASAGVAAAQDPVDAVVVRSRRVADGNVRTVKVDFADLDVRTSKGAATLADRLVAASEEACGGRPAAMASSVEKLAFSECRSNAMFDAVREVRSPMLTRVTHGGHAPALRWE